LQQNERDDDHLRDVLPADREDVQRAGAAEILLDVGRDFLAITDEHASQKIGHARVVLEPDLEPRVGPVARAEREVLPPIAAARFDALPIERRNRRVKINALLRLIGTVIEFAGTERRRDRHQLRGELEAIAAAEFFRRPNHGAAHVALRGPPWRIDLRAKKAPLRGTPRFHAQHERRAIQRTARRVRGELRGRFLDDEAAPLRGIEELFIGQAAQVTRGNRHAKQQRMRKPGAGREKVERDQRTDFVTGQHQPRHQRRVKEKERHAKRDRSIQTEQAPHRKSQADRKERRTQRKHLAGNGKEIVPEIQMNALPRKRFVVGLSLPGSRRLGGATGTIGRLRRKTSLPVVPLLRADPGNK
jgi:hypothetical protein